MYKVIKLVMDWVLAFAGLLFLALPLLLVGIAIKIDSKGPAVFKQERIGKDMKPIMVYKFRTMKSCSVKFDIDNPVIKDDNQNLTRVGKGIRKLKIDEFLQLFNVLRGEMSLIGPRPLMPVYMQTYQEWEKRKFAVRPGLSGLSQVKGNGYLSSRERSYYDVKYAENYNFAMDVEILFKTAGVVFLGEKKYLCPVDEKELEAIKRHNI